MHLQQQVVYVLDICKPDMFQKYFYIYCHMLTAQHKNKLALFTTFVAKLRFFKFWWSLWELCWRLSAIHINKFLTNFRILEHVFFNRKGGRRFLFIFKHVRTDVIHAGRKYHSESKDMCMSVCACMHTHLRVCICQSLSLSIYLSTYWTTFIRHLDRY